MYIALKKRPMIGIIHDLSNGRTGAFRNNAVHHAFTLGHPSAGKAHIFIVSNSVPEQKYAVLTYFCIKKQRNTVYSTSVSVIYVNNLGH